MSGIAYCEPHQLASWLRGPEKPGLVILDVRDDVGPAWAITHVHAAGCAAFSCTRYAACVRAALIGLHGCLHVPLHATLRQ